MLSELEINNLGPIRHACLSLSAGMTAITGETGAGKSMLLNAIRLISGGKADAAQVSGGAGGVWVQGVFAVLPPGAAARVAQDAGITPSQDDNELFLSRAVPSSGRSRAVLSGHSVPRSVLVELAAQLVTIHGQADQLRLASVSRQREFLDMVAADDAAFGMYRKAWESLQSMDERLRTLGNQEASMRQHADYLRESVDRINEVDPHPGEDDELKERRSRIEHAADIARGVSQALAALDASQIDVDADGTGAAALISQSAQALRSIHVPGLFTQIADRLEALNADLADIVFSLSSQLGPEENVDSLDSLNARIHELGELTRRWGPSLQDVIAWRDQAMRDMEDLDDSPQKLEELRAQRREAYSQALQAAGVLSRSRIAAAKELSKAVNGELSSLAMSGAKLDIRVTQRAKTVATKGGANGNNGSTVRNGSAGNASNDRGFDEACPGDTGALDAHGFDDIEFLFTPFPGSPQLPMGTSASGGELSRLMLALELSAADRHSGKSGGVEDGIDGAGDDESGADANADMTFIFDEVDAGVGGKAAVELGRRLALLARHAQVIVVTHLAQVASWADAQFVVSKSSDRDGRNGEIGGTDAANKSSTIDEADKGAAINSAEKTADSTPTISTGVREVRGEERIREIARMLSGSESHTSLDHARELLAASAV
ncbi:DNA repair protein RecN [Bifidobacterium sp.]|jgi:DNA repair protein RecN (Recombination protein N)|uniref:DNA repair protein RecN n=1 Tax=Bifidobacterium sp. TaxID=41200 RepID=UPI0025C5591E|nr:DNA repair protein RecN [Bifidobacterium sp.]MCH4209223.1 DNA repair protein RecN [Bifidobacterium sp.]MCI1224666.1 DNA repair protein RecN [Bifidobacterium sp.]